MSGPMLPTNEVQFCGFMDAYEERGNRFPRNIGDFKTTLSQCKECGYCRYDPLPSEADLDAYYQAEYGEVSASVYDFEIQYNRPDLDAVAQHIIDTIRTYGYKGDDQLEAHDVGCAMGTLTYILRKHGVNATGNEINRGWVELGNRFCDGALSWEKTADIFKHSSRRLHFVSFLHTLEHMPNPLDELLEIRLRMHQDGIIYICVPNALFLPTAVFGKESDENFVFPGHIHYYTPKSMSCLLRAAGLKIMHLETRASHFSPNGKDALLRAATGMDAAEVLDDASLTTSLANNFRTAELHVIATRSDRVIDDPPVLEKIERGAVSERPFWRRAETALLPGAGGGVCVLITDRPTSVIFEWSTKLRELAASNALVVSTHAGAEAAFAQIAAEGRTVGQVIADRIIGADRLAAYKGIAPVPALVSEV